MGALSKYPPLQRKPLSIPAEVLEGAKLLDEIGINRLLFTTDVAERRLIINRVGVYAGEFLGVYVYKMKNGTTYGITKLVKPLPLSRFYSYLVESYEGNEIGEGVENKNQKLILNTDCAGRAIAFINKNDSQTVRVRIKSEVVEDNAG